MYAMPARKCGPSLKRIGDPLVVDEDWRLQVGICDRKEREAGARPWRASKIKTRSSCWTWRDIIIYKVPLAWMVLYGEHNLKQVPVPKRYSPIWREALCELSGEKGRWFCQVSDDFWNPNPRYWAEECTECQGMSERGGWLWGVKEFKSSSSDH